MIVDPLVTWIWIGAIIIALGGLIALWPVPSVAWRRVRVRAPSTAPAPAPAAGPAAPAVTAVAEPVVSER